MKKGFLIGLVGILFLTGCEPSEKQIAKKLEEEIIAKHDEAMAKMGDIDKTIKALTKLKNTYMVDSLNHAHHLAKLEDCNQAIQDLEEADKAMMKWMHEFKIPEETVPDGEKIKYFESEKEKIIMINDEIEKGIHEGRHFVRRFYDDIADEHKEKEAAGSDSTSTEETPANENGSEEEGEGEEENADADANADVQV